VSFSDATRLWRRSRKHSQRLVLLCDCAGSGHWVAALRALGTAEQLELSVAVQVGPGGLRVMWGAAAGSPSALKQDS
jgi:hypothetical protein